MEAIPTPPTQREDLTLRMAADLILCCVRTLRKEIARGRLRAFRVGNRIFIKWDDFATYLEEREIPIDADVSGDDTSERSDAPGYISAGFYRSSREGAEAYPFCSPSHTSTLTDTISPMPSEEASFEEL